MVLHCSGKSVATQYAAYFIETDGRNRLILSFDFSQIGAFDVIVFK